MPGHPDLAGQRADGPKDASSEGEPIVHERTGGQPAPTAAPATNQAPGVVTGDAVPPTLAVESPPGRNGAMNVVVAAEVLRRVNRTRQVVSLVSQVIIRSYEEEALHAEICRFLVTFGGYLMAWVGLAEEKPEKGIRPVAHAGLEANFLEALKITWPNDLAQRSPTIRAIQEQRPHVARNIPTDPLLEGLRPEAKLYGYVATCAVPLQFAGHGLGVLTIHSAEPDAFGAEEVSLLRELASDLAAGVIALREKAKRELLEEVTRKAEARSRSIIESAHEGIFQCDLEGRLILVNGALVQLLGYGSQEEMLAVTPPFIGTHLGTKETNPLIRARGERDVLEAQPIRLRAKDGHFVWALIRVRKAEGPDGPIQVGFVQDMTGPRAEREASARLAAVVDAAEDAIVGNDVHGCVSEWNQGAVRLFGYSREEVIGRPIGAFLVPLERADENTKVQTMVASGMRVPRFETERICKRGKVIHTSVTLSPIFAGEGEFVGSTTVEHDITQARTAAAAKRAKDMEETEVAKLKSMEKIRKTFMSEASHELNTPLTPLRTHVEALVEDTVLTREQRGHMVVIERNVLRLCNLVKDMLEASRLETGLFRLELADVPLHALVGETVQGLAEIASKAGVTIDFGPATPLAANADRNRIGQVLYNLLTNAISFTPRGGRITVDIQAGGGGATVRVTDTGVGLSEAQLGQLFQPFSRPHEGSGSAPKGTGLGLFISKGIIEQHGGKLWAESPGTGNGSSFCFFLPLTSPTPDANQPSNQVAGGRRYGMRRRLAVPESRLENARRP